MTELFTAYCSSPIGQIEIQCTSEFVCSVKFVDTNNSAASQQHPMLDLAISQLHEYFEGKRKQFDLPLKQNGSPFQQQVWQLLQEVGYGATLSYLQFSKLYGDPKAIRAVAAANGKNNIWIVVPCHRIIGSKGELTGYAGGTWRKRWLLDHEAKHSGKQQLTIDWSTTEKH